MHEICLHTWLSPLRTSISCYAHSTASILNFNLHFTSLDHTPSVFLFQSRAVLLPSLALYRRTASFHHNTQRMSRIACRRCRRRSSTFLLIIIQLQLIISSCSLLMFNPTQQLLLAFRSFVSFFCTHTVSCHLLLSVSSQKHPPLHRSRRFRSRVAALSSQPNRRSTDENA